MNESKTYASEGGHWYRKDGEPCYDVPKSKGDGMRKTTIADARKLHLLPSVTTILAVLDKPALTKWKQKNAIEAALTTPRNEGESLDDFAERVLAVDTESVSDAAKQRGTDIHAAIEQSLMDSNAIIDEGIKPFVLPVLDSCSRFGVARHTEKTCVGDGYAGKLDAVFADKEMLTVVDFKTTKTLPKDSYWEHQMQTAAYAQTFGNTGNNRIRTANIYIDSTTPGKIAVFVQDEWTRAASAFNLILRYWQVEKNYIP